MSISCGCLILTERPTRVPEIVLIRDMTDADSDQVLAIYQQGIATGHATFEHEIPPWAEFSGKRRATPRLVAEVNGRIAGWAALASVSARPVYAGVCEHSIYIDENARGKGVGASLLQAFLEEALDAGIWMIESRIFPENTASLRLHLSCGFRVVGRRKRMGKMPYGPMKGVWRDCILVEWRRDQTLDE